MNFILRMRSLFKRTGVSYDRREEYELAPGLKCTICFEDNNNNLSKVVEQFLRRKASIGELRQVSKY